MESIFSFQNWRQSFQSRLGVDRLFSLVDLDYEHADVAVTAAPPSPRSVGSATTRSGGTTMGAVRSMTTARVNVLVPPFDAPARRLSAPSATILLVTIVCTNVHTWQGLVQVMQTGAHGILWASLALLLGALWSERALLWLCAAVRRSGVISYAEVAWIAFSYRAELVVASLLHVYLLLLMVQQLVAIRQLLDSILTSVSSSIMSTMPHASFLTNHISLILWIVLVVAATPTLTIRDVFPLRIVATMSLICLSGVLVLLYILGISRALHPSSDMPPDTDDNENMDATASLSLSISFVSTAIKCTLLAFSPSFVLMLPVHAALHEPTNARVVKVIRRAVWASFAMLWLIAMAFFLLSKTLPAPPPQQQDEQTAYHSNYDQNYLLLLGHWFSSQSHSVMGGFLATLVQIFASLALLLATLVLMQPCRSNVLECAQRHYVNSTIPSEDGCCCEDHNNLLHCDKLHEYCPEDCLKDDAETAQTTVPSFTSQSTTPRINNNAFSPVVSSAPAAYTDIYGRNTYPPPLQVHVARSHTTASEMTPLMSGSGAGSGSGSGSDDNKADDYRSTSSSAASRSADQRSVPSLSSSEDQQSTQGRILQVRRQLKASAQQMVNDIEQQQQQQQQESSQDNEDGRRTLSRPPCNIESNRLVRGYSSALIWMICYCAAIIVFDWNDHHGGRLSRVVSVTETLVEMLIVYILPVACFLKLHPRRGSGIRR